MGGRELRQCICNVAAENGRLFAKTVENGWCSVRWVCFLRKWPKMDKNGSSGWNWVSVLGASRKQFGTRVNGLKQLLFGIKRVQAAETRDFAQKLALELETNENACWLFKNACWQSKIRSRGWKWWLGGQNWFKTVGNCCWMMKSRSEVRKRAIAVVDRCRWLVFDGNGTCGPKIREDGWKRVLMTKSGLKHVSTIKPGIGDWKRVVCLEDSSREVRSRL